MRGYLLIFIAVGALILLGLNITERGINDVLRNGYSTTARVASAEVTGRKFPFVFDGWRPRWVDENLSVALTWTGRDGVERTHNGVPVSSASAGKILTGDKVKLIETRVRVIDDDSSLPVIEADVNDRLRNIRSLSELAQTAVLALGVAFMSLLAWGRFAKADRGMASRTERPFSYGLMVLATLAVFFLCSGGFMARQSWKEQREFREMREHGDVAMAEMSRAYVDIPRAGDPPSHRVELSWRDASGEERVFGPTHVSADFWRQITANDVQTVKRTEIRYLTADPTARPIIVADTAEREFQDSFGVKGGLVFVAFGLILGSLLVYLRRRQSEEPMARVNLS
jgi:hypothetical protein